MTETPSIIERADVPYVAIAATVTMGEIGAVIPPLNTEVFEWLRSRGIPPAGAPFWRYDVIDMERGLVIEAGVPIAEPVEGDARVRAGILPSGRYASVVHVGHPQTLENATARLLEWGTEHDVEWDAAPTPDGERWGCRLEIYRSTPDQDMDEWATELAFRVTDDDE